MLLPTPGRSAAPIVEYGVGAVTRAPDIARQLRARRVLLVCGKTSFEASGAVSMLPDLHQAATVLRWDEFAPNTDSADLAVGLRLLQDFQPDLVLGVGGGSAIDMAKLLVSYHDLAPEEVVPVIESGRKAETRTSRLALIPTTSGSGAEATHFAVVYVGDEKHSIAGPAMRADAIVLDPALTLSGSPYQRATSGIDAVAQGIESLWAVAATDRSRRFARHALRLLMPSIETYVNAPDERSARAMVIGSHLAGRAIDISKTTAAHALSYAITKKYGVSHGHAVALTLGGFIEAHADAAPGALQPVVEADTHSANLDEVLRRLHAKGPHDARDRFCALLDRIGLAADLSSVGVTTTTQRDELVASINLERVRNNPVRFDADSLGALLVRGSCHTSTRDVGHVTAMEE